VGAWTIKSQKTQILVRKATTVIFLALLSAAGAAPLSYNRDIRPILSENCFACHGPDKEARKAKMRLDVRESAVKKEAIVPGDPEGSEMIHLINTDDEDDLMPPADSHKALTAEEKKILAEWIKQGADYEPHWAYMKPVRPEVPKMGGGNPIDNIILAGLKEGSRELSVTASPNVLARRLSLDLTGLPPLVTGMSDPAADLDRLLSSPHFGERMAIYWLDLVRYADTVGYHNDVERDVTPYRDYVIEAFNKNKPYNEFIVQQLAGDLLENPTVEDYVATTFNRVNQISGEGGIQDAEYIAKYYSERVRTTSVAFLGSTMGCSECHDHKFDPFTAKDFYAMEAFFADIYEKGAYNGDGRYNEGADIKEYPGFTLSNWGPVMQVPPSGREEKLAALSAERRRLEGEKEKTTPELRSAFGDWVKDLRAKSGASEPQDVAILDDEELPLAGVEKVTDNVHSGTIARRQKGDGLVQHIVETDANPVILAGGDKLFAWVWLDPKDPPKQIMLQFHGESGWNQRVWWGEDLISYGKGSKKADHFHGGALPALGEWVRVEVPAGSVGFSAGSKITKMAYTQFGGTVLWDLAGRHTDTADAVLASFPENVREALKKSNSGALSEEEKALIFDYYRTIAPSLAPVRDALAMLDEQEKELKSGGRTTLVTLSTKPREIRVLPRGNWMDRSGEVVLPELPGFLTVEGSLGAGKERLSRLDLAHWIASPDNPLTARAFVNRVWALFLGTGLSRDLQDLGNQGQWPTHPELLDWLSVEFMESGWDVKKLVKLIVTSRTYQQSSNVSASLQEQDPYNLLYARQNPRRLPAEFVRDNALAVSGLLNPQVGGPSARPYQPDGYYAQLNFPKREYQPHKDANQYRRGVYMHWQRSYLHPMLVAFDAPAREECTASREISNTPLQALNLLNDPTFVEAARVLAQELVAANEQINERLELAFDRLLLRRPTAEELTLLGELHHGQLERYKADPEAAKQFLGVGLAPVPDTLDPADLAATTAVTRALFNLHESITRY